MEQQVRAAVQKYVDGCTAANADMVADAFTPDATMWGYLNGEYTTMSGADFAAHVIAGAQPADEAYEAHIHGITVSGDVAHAVLDEKQFLGLDFRNFFGLIRKNGTWRIASKVFTSL